MHAKRMIAVVVTALGFAASGAYASTEANTDTSTYVELDSAALEGLQLARRGRGKDDVQADDRRARGDKANRGGKRGADDRGGSGRKKPRVPGGSGCDDAEDILEHPACAV